MGDKIAEYELEDIAVAILDERSSQPALLVDHMIAKLREMRADLLSGETHPEMKEVLRWKLRLMYLAATGHNDHQGAPYPDAKMKLVGCVKHAGKPCKPPTPAKPAIVAASDIAFELTLAYPRLTARFREPERMRLLAEAVREQRLKQRRKRPQTAWDAIAKVWEGIEAEPQRPADEPRVSSPGKLFKYAWRAFMARRKGIEVPD